MSEAVPHLHSPIKLGMGYPHTLQMEEAYCCI
jgi:hypothetical protein